MDGAEGPASKNEALGEIQKMFVEGDLVVYPNHGAGRVTGIEEKTVLGEVRRYYVVYLPDAELTVSIPADGDIGLRVCADEESLAKRLTHNREKIRSGEISQVAEVIRNLSAYGAEHGLSTGERNMLMKARQILASEIALIRDIEVTEAEKLVDGALRADDKGDAE